MRINLSFLLQDMALDSFFVENLIGDNFLIGDIIKKPVSVLLINPVINFAIRFL